MKYPAYRQYKDTGVAWLGVVPEHWEIKRLSYITQCLDGKRIPLNREQRSEMQGEYPYWGANCVVDYVNQWLFDEPLVLLGEDGAPFFDPNKPVSFFVNGKIWVNNHAHVLRTTNELEERFLAYALNCVGYGAFIDGATRDKLTQSDMNSIQVQFPPKIEQTAIADFLDRETERIDTLVAKKRKLVALLKEKRSALISRTVTRGLPADAAREFGLEAHIRLRPSGIEWLGPVPEKWAVIPLKLAIRFIEGPGIMASDFTDDGIPLLRISSIGKRLVTLDGCNYVSHDLGTTRWSHFRVKKHDLLISGSASTGFCSEVDEDTVGSIPYTGIIIIRPYPKTDRGFTRWFFLSNLFVDQSNLAKTGSTIQHFGPTHLSRMFIAFPPKEEQTAIATYLDRETAKIDRLVEKVETAITRLQEYRSALITAAVTGKIDVREYV
ncbi:restriction endonuclease subunit S [Methylomonas sp. SURF-1]|uniref:Restriction endonuclease subunit S n=1 Tax=Methylomonas aurea TaxID=2952224 RepID=A0ABT1UN68_9GAMM|nr:restriction endonuclease subunit S [Methylomonas sp. SURF-1]MCQ8183691.1 restriction endonuclease subunit S [Methylomonas sp. SURF-1]